jgi:hypothetical protein
VCIDDPIPSGVWVIPFHLHPHGVGEVVAFNEIISSFCVSLERDDIRRAWQHWLVLKQLAEFPGRSQDLISREIPGGLGRSRPSVRRG